MDDICVYIDKQPRRLESFFNSVMSFIKFVDSAFWNILGWTVCLLFFSPIVYLIWLFWSVYGILGGIFLVLLLKN